MEEVIQQLTEVDESPQQHSMKLPDQQQQQCKKPLRTQCYCSAKVSPGEIYCEKHRLEQDLRNEKKRKGATKKPSSFLMDPLLPSGHPRCRRKVKEWRCSHIATHGLYCEKHQLEQKRYNEMKRKRKIEEKKLVSSSGSYGDQEEIIKHKEGLEEQTPFVMEIGVQSKEIATEASVEDQQQCRRYGTRWRCSAKASPAKIYCEKHRLLRDLHNEQRRKGPKKESPFLMDPLLPSGHPQCRRTGKGWRCHQIASHGIYCEKHYLERKSRNGKKRKREREESLVASGSDEREEDAERSIGDVRLKRPTKDCGGKQVINDELAVKSGEEMIERRRGRKKSTKKKTISDKNHTEASIKDDGENDLSIVETGEQSKEGVLEASAEDPNFITPSREIVDVVQAECISKGTAISVTERFGNIEDVQSLSMWSEETSEKSYSPASLNSGVSPDNQLESPSNMAIISREASMKSHEVHKVLCQQKNESLCEGHTVGYMLSFAKIVKETWRAQLNEPKSTLESKLKALVELEAVGLNVQPIRAWFDKLLRIKDSQEHLDADLKQVEGMIIKEKDEEELLDLEVDEIDNKLRDLKESISQMIKRLEKVEMEKQTTGSSIAALHEKICEIEEEIMHINLEVNSVAAAP